MESNNGNVDFVGPLFLWISPIEAKVEGNRKNRPKLTLPATNNVATATAALTTPPIASSSLLKAKTALQRRFSGGNSSELLFKRVNEALDACIWLKSAGFPQYVQKFEAGEFPMNLSKLRVERDHSFLDSPAIETLIKRLNVLNRCADLLEEILEKTSNIDSDEEDDDMRAISDHWHKSNEGQWSRRSTTNGDIGDTEGDTEDRYNPSAMLVTELSSSPTRRTQGTVKTYAFSPTHTPDDPLADGRGPEVSMATRRPLLKVFPPSEDMGDEQRGGGGEEDEEQLDLLGSFASGILDKFETTLAKLHKGNALSRSLPNVYSISTGLEVMDSSITSRFSVASEASSMESSKDDLLSDEEYSTTPTRSSRIDGKGGAMLSDWARPDRQTSLQDQFDQFPNGEYTPSNYSNEGTPTHMSRRTTLESIGSNSLHEVFELQTTPPSQPVKAKWHSFNRQYSFRRVFKPVRTHIPIEELSAGQITILRKLCLIRLTALLELHNGKANVSRILKGKRNKNQLKSSKGIFGSSLEYNVLKYGSALPPVIIRAMNYIRMEGMETVGLFRRTAAKSSIESLKVEIELNPDTVDFSEYTNYQVADSIKLFFRELPEPLLTSKLSEALIACYECIPDEVRLQALQAIALLLPDAHREALHCLLYFLKYISSHSKVHQMDARNLGLCLSPSLFSLSCPPRTGGAALSRRGSFRRTRAVNTPSAITAAGHKELSEHMYSSRCLTDLVIRYEAIFAVPADMLQTCKFTHLEFGDPVPYTDLGRDREGMGGYHSYVEECIATVTKDQRKKYRGWVSCQSQRDVNIAYCKLADGVPLKLWRASVEIPVVPKVLFRKLWDERYMWDGNVVNARQVAVLDPQTDIFQYVTSSIPPEAHRDHCVLRSWRQDPSNNTYSIVVTSVSHPNATLLGRVRCTELVSRYWIEETSEGHSHLTHYYRVDLRGRSPDFYNHSFGHYLGSCLQNLRSSFNKRSIELESCIETPV